MSDPIVQAVEAIVADANSLDPSAARCLIGGEHAVPFPVAHIAHLLNRVRELEAGDAAQEIERRAQIAAHRVCCGVEHDPANGKLHGCCVVCGVDWPCEYAGDPPARKERDA